MQSDPANPVHPAPGVAAVPLFHAAWLFAMGIVITHNLWLPPTFLLLAIMPLAVLCLLSALRAQRIAWFPLAALWIIPGAWCGAMQPQPAPAPELAALSDGLLRTVEGTVVDAGAVRSEREENVDGPPAVQVSQSIDLRLTGVELVNDQTDALQPVSGEVRLTVRRTRTSSAGRGSESFRCGDRIRAVARLLPPGTYHDPGVWSRPDYLLDKGITSTATVDLSRVVLLEHSSGASLACRWSGWQHVTTARLLALPLAMQKLPRPLRLSEDDTAMLAAMIAGDRTYLTRTLRIGFERTGSFHMLVVSGLHLAIVAGCIFWIASRFRLPQVPATLLTLAASFAYAFFTGFATPVQRSLWMVTLYLIGRLVYRERNALNTIGCASLCLLVVNPRSLFDSSFEMTLLAVVAIAGVAAPILQSTVHPYSVATRDLRLIAIDIKLAPKLAQFRVVIRMVAERLARVSNLFIAWRAFPWLIRLAIRLIEFVLVAIVVELAMTLPMAVYFHRITIFALPVNLLILPLLAVLVPAALLTLLLLTLWPSASLIAAAVVAMVLHAGVGLVHLFGSISVGDMRVPGPLAWQSAAFIAFLASAILLSHRGAAAASRRLRRGPWAALAMAALVSVMPRPIEQPKGAMLIEAIDVGQGDSLLVVTPDGKTLLVDAGGFGGGPRQAPQDFDIGEEVVSSALWARGIRNLDAVALAHAHSDHMGGMPAVLLNFHPHELWVGNNPHFAAYDQLIDEARNLHVDMRTFRAGDAFAFGNARVNVLAPFRDYVPEQQPANNDSLVLHIAYLSTSDLLEGDAEQPIEDAMLSEPGLEKARCSKSDITAASHPRVPNSWRGWRRNGP